MSESKLTAAFPDGSVQKVVLDVMRRGGLELSIGNDRHHHLICSDKGLFKEAFLVRPSESPELTADGRFDVAITGQDWLYEQGMTRRVREVMTLPVSRSGSEQVRIVLAVAANSKVREPLDLKPGSVVYTEYTRMSRQKLRKLGVTPTIRYSYGRTEGKIPLGIADAIVELVDSGESFRQNDIRIVRELFVSKTCLIANPAAWENQSKRARIKELADSLALGVSSLQAENRAKAYRFVKCDVKPSLRSEALAILKPYSETPTISPTEGGGYAIEAMVPQHKAHEVRALLERLGATKTAVSVIESLSL